MRSSNQRAISKDSIRQKSKEKQIQLDEMTDVIMNELAAKMDSLDSEVEEKNLFTKHAYIQEILSSISSNYNDVNYVESLKFAATLHNLEIPPHSVAEFSQLVSIDFFLVQAPSYLYKHYVHYISEYISIYINSDNCSYSTGCE